eukprot:scaffold6320_cov169-Amphora_coffeaeformis.AAC.5
MDEFNVGGGDSSDDDQVVSSDDETGRFGRRMPRARYSTVDDDDDDDDDDQVRRPKRSREEAIYGVFMDDDSDNEGFRKKLRNKKSFFKETSLSSRASKTAPLFVKGDVLQDEDEGVQEGDDNDNPAPPDDDSKPASKSTFQSARVGETKQTEQTEQSPPTEEDLALKKQREEANQQFLSLLDRAKRKQQSRTVLAKEDENETRKELRQEESSAPALGLGMSGGIGSNTDTPSATSVMSFTSASAMPALGLGMKPPPVRKDPNLGTWEKHTKGIGMKLLSKMGYKGSGGLGSKRRQAGQKTGISRAVEVKVRPANLGLGFGGFREASTLKVNRQLEAQVRGEAVPEPTASATAANNTGKPPVSSLPTVDELLEDSVWLKGAREVKKKKGNKKRTVIPYSQLLESKDKEQQQMKIIDMRGPGAAAAAALSTPEGSGAVGQPSLGEELLHNVSLLLNTYESKLHSHSQFASAAEQKLGSLESEVADLERQRVTLRERTQKMEKASEILDEYEEKVKRGNFEAGAPTQLDAAVSLVKGLCEVFSPSDQKSLKFDTTLAPTLLGDALQRTLKKWNPLRKATDEGDSMGLVNSVLKLEPGLEENAVLPLKRNLFINYVLPKIQKSYESAHWNAQEQSETAIRFYEKLIALIRQGFDSSTAETEHESSENIPEGDQLIDKVRRTIIFETVHPKLERALSTWKPSLDQNSLLINPLHIWILPWVPFLDHPGILPTLMAQCKRRMESTASYLARKIPNDDMVFLGSFDSALKPWAKAFKSSSVHDLTSKYASERVAACLMNHEFNTEGRRIMFKMHENGLMSTLDFLALLEFDLLRHCVVPAHAEAKSQLRNARKIAEAYVEQKCRLEREAEMHPISRNSLRSDELISRCFLGILRTIEALSGEDPTALDRLESPLGAIPYTSIRSRRIRDRKRSAQVEILHMESGTKDKLATQTRAKFIRQGNDDKATFREVIEELCLQESIPFVPRTTGARTHVDGKQVFLIGSIPIYLDSDVVFEHKGNNHWEPVSLDALLERARGP